MTVTLEREAPVRLHPEHESRLDLPDHLIDGHGLLISAAIIVSLAIVSLVAIYFIGDCEPKGPATKSAMLMTADPKLP